MSAYLDNRDECWRDRKRITLPSGQKIRIKGTPAINTKVSAEQAERDHIERLLHPDRFKLAEAMTATATGRAPTVCEVAKKFLDE